MKISLIAAISENHVIGKDNKLLWKISTDMKLFKSYTTGHHIIMGRKTFESFDFKPLPNRPNIVISKDPDYKKEGCTTCNSYEQALKIANDAGEQEVFVIGGGEIYKIAIEKADILYISHIHVSLEGDTVFPDIDKSVWHIKEKQQYFKDEKNQYDFDFCVYERSASE